MQQLRLSVFVAELHNRKEEVRRAEEEGKERRQNGGEKTQRRPAARLSTADIRVY